MTLGSLLCILWLFCLPKPLFDAPTATIIESSDGQLIGARIATDGQWRFPASDSVPNRFKTCIRYFEDEYFYEHPGFNPIALSKALWQNVTTDTRRGGSTLTQQVIRLARKNKQRTYGEKGIEIFMATRLETVYTKDEILNFYASHAPFGGNVVGLETAAWRYFGIPAHQLSWGQSAALAVLPNAPALIFPGKNEVLFKNKRDRLLKKLFDKNIIDQVTYELSVLEPLPGKPIPLPAYASHLTDKLKKEKPGKRIRSTIDSYLQKQLTRIAAEHHYVLQQNEIHNLAAIVIDVETKQVLGYIGNAASQKEHSPYVNIIDRPRSTGSILKPFLYTAALESGELLPNTLVADIPTIINGYRPDNFDRSFQGAIPASEALSRSLNVPAVRLLRSYGLQKFHNDLDALALHSINKNPEHYGLSIILGGSESTLWEITNAYASMASTLNFYTQSSSEYRAREFTSATFEKSEILDLGERQHTPPVFDAGAIYNAFEAMREVNRPRGEENWSFFNSSKPIAWKTGTSFGFKDGWTVGVTPKYAIGVWVGNADGEGRPGLTGLQAAAPLLFEILNTLPESGWFDIPYDALVEATICKESGHIATAYCDHTNQEYIGAQGMKTKACPYHKPVFLNADETARVNSSCYDLTEMHQKNWFSLPPSMEYYYAAKNPDYRPLPPFQYNCIPEGESLMEFIYPSRNESIILPKNFNETLNEVIFSVAHRTPETSLYWYLDDVFIGTTETFHELAYIPKPGNYTLTVTDQNGHQISQQIAIAIASR